MGCAISTSPVVSAQVPQKRSTHPRGQRPQGQGQAKVNKLTPRNWTNVVAFGGGAGRSRSASKSCEKLFVDDEFPPNDSSVFRHKPITKKIVWKRPGELCRRPMLISDGTSRHDMKQGDLNDCWFLSTLSAIAEKPQLMSKIIPDDYAFDNPDYNGKFHCRFWQFGEWVDIYIDDLLPTVNGEILFAHSSDPDEFWVSLVEKAYAKLNQSYESLEYGFEADAFTDLTGGLAEWYNPQDLREEDFYLIRAAFQCGAVVGCLSVDKEGRCDRKKKGMVSNHSYVITGVEEIAYTDSTVKLIRVRNPWGDTEWEGPWSDGSEEWLHVSEETKCDLELTSQDDGEFWMCYNDFRREFCNMIICNLSPDFDHDGISDKAEYQIVDYGCWRIGENAGGWLECDTFHHNPQYIVTLHPDANIQRRFSGRLPLVISLIQVYKRHQKLDGIGLYAVGFELFQLFGSTTNQMSKSFFDKTDPLMPENEETYAEYRETSGRFFLEPGDYLLVPSTQQVNQERDYLLRLYSVSKMECSPLANCIDDEWEC
ncbi:hypothetical protein ScPMuIL_017689 [Solemya velum]